MPVLNVSQGIIDEVRNHHRALSAGEIQAALTQALWAHDLEPPPEPPEDGLHMPCAAG
jgi:hypothetical protein